MQKPPAAVPLPRRPVDVVCPKQRHEQHLGPHARPTGRASSQNHRWPEQRASPIAAVAVITGPAGSGGRRSRGWRCSSSETWTRACGKSASPPAWSGSAASSTMSHRLPGYPIESRRSREADRTEKKTQAVDGF